ncbi:hypothetical protein [Pradoshia sp.]
MKGNDYYEWIRSIVLKVTADPYVQEKFWRFLMATVEKERNK